MCFNSLLFFWGVVFCNLFIYVYCSITVLDFPSLHRKPIFMLSREFGYCPCMVFVRRHAIQMPCEHQMSIICGTTIVIQLQPVNTSNENRSGLPSLLSRLDSVAHLHSYGIHPPIPISIIHGKLNFSRAKGISVFHKKLLLCL